MDDKKRPGHAERGITTLLVVAFIGVFMLVMGTITSYVFQQSKYGRALFAREQALHIAEAGLEYYKWFLARTSSALQTGSGLVTPYTYAVSDPEGGAMGDAQVTATAALQCGRTQWIDLTSKGTSNSDVRFPRTLLARYMKPSIGEYAFVTDTGVWYASNVTGPVHANGGVRMDGTNNSTVSSALGANAFWCDASFGCSPSQWKNGVFGNGSGSALWQFPVSSINFSAMSADFPSLKTYAQVDGIMLNPTNVTRDGIQQGSSFSSVGGSEQRGFHVVFKTGNLIDIYRVTSTNQIASYNTVRGYLFGSNYCSYLNTNYPGQYQCENTYDYPDIASETIVASNVSVPSSCSLIYSEAKTWISGTVSGKVAIVANDTGSFKTDILIGGTVNISDGYLAYATTDGTTGLTAIAERSVHVAHRVPDAMSIRGIFVAQGGYFGRDYYYYNYNVDPYFGGSLSPYRLRTSLTTNGTVASAYRAATAYGSPITSGFQNRFTTYDRMQAFTPPPFTPSAYVDYGYALWREQ